MVDSRIRTPVGTQGNTLSGVSTPAPKILTKRQKAAVIVRLLLAEGIEVKLTSLPESLQEELTMQMSYMRFIDRTTLRTVIDEFVSEIEDIGLAFPNGLEGALSVLDGSISDAAAARMRRLGGVKNTGNAWEIIIGQDADTLFPVLEEESPEIAAVMLSKLKVSVAAELLGRLPGKRARQITYALSLTGSISPEVVEKIGKSLSEQLNSQKVTAFADSPVERAGAILNFSPAATRDDVLQGLEEDDAKFAREVRKAIFTFANIPARVDPRDVPKITRDIDQADLITALAAATGPLEEACEFILGSMSKRMAEQLREEIGSLGKVKEAEGEAAMNIVIGNIRELESAGDIVLVDADEENDDDNDDAD